MHEHTIPESLVAEIRTGRAVLVVGAGVGIASWKQLLERLNEALASRGNDGDDAASKDVAKLLSKGHYARAAGFLARTLGSDTCQAIVSELWATPQNPDTLPPATKLIARLPFRHVWTTLPGELIERAMAAELPEGWPAPEVLTYAQAADIKKSRRTLLKILGDTGSHILTSQAARQALQSGANGLGAYAREIYAEGTLVLVGFRHGDPDLTALLEQIFNSAPAKPPTKTHYLIASGIGPVTADELASEHRIQAIPLPGKGGDDTVVQALIEYLEALHGACAAAKLTLASSRPGDDDLEGWLALLADEPEPARAAIERMEAAARAAKDADRLIEILVGRVEHEHAHAARAKLLRQMAAIFETELGDLPQAFTALTAALREDPADTSAVDEAERLAAATDSWTELVTDVSQIAGEIEDAAIAAGYWARLGRWYAERLDHGDYASLAYRQALKLDRRQLAAYAGLAELYRKQQRWGDLADLLGEHVAVETEPAKQIDLYLALGDLCESQLASTARAIDAYQEALALDRSSDDALAALERLYRRDERWAKLGEILEQRAQLIESHGVEGAQQASALRRELATLRADKLGDVDGAIAKYEAALAAEAGDLEALRALTGLYEKVGRTDDYLRTLERLADAVPEAEAPTILRRLAAEIEDKEPRKAARLYERIVAIEGTGTAADDAYRALERVLRAEGDWYELVHAYERHIEAAAGKTPAERAALHLELAAVYESQLEDPHRALGAFATVLELEPEHRAALTAAARLYQRTESWARAIAALVAHAKLPGLDAGASAALWLEAGILATTHQSALAGTPGTDAKGEPGSNGASDWARNAESYLEKALELDPGNHAGMIALAKLHKTRGRWSTAADLLVRAAGIAQHRLERVELLTEAANIAEEHLGDSARCLDLCLRVLDQEPEEVEVGRRAAKLLLAAERWTEAIPVLEKLARKSEDKHERARACLSLGRACEATKQFDMAATHYQSAVDIDPDSLEAAQGLGNALFAAAKQHTNDSDEDDAGNGALWNRVDGAYRNLLARHRSGLADSQVVEIWYRLGVTARTLGALDKADDALRRALEIEPQHQPSLIVRIEVARSRGDWKTVVEAWREQLAAMPKDDAEARLTALTEIGDISYSQLADPDRALGAYLEALSLKPHSYVLLHKLLNIYTAQGEWRRAIDILTSLANHETLAERRAKYRYAAAVIARDELHDAELAALHFDRVLDDAPANQKAFDALDRLLTDKGDYKGLARAYRKMLKRVGESAPIESLLPLWTRLGELSLEQLGDTEAAITALEVASSLEPDNMVRHEQLANLYLEAGASRRAEAITELQLLLHHDPNRVELYRALSNLYTEAGETDKAYCLAQALTFLGAATTEEKALFEHYRPVAFAVARRRMTEELWLKSVIHPREDRHVSALFGTIIGAIAATTAQPASAFDLGERAKVGRDATRVIARVFKYVSDILALDPEPHLYVQDGADGQGIRIANTREGDQLVPSVLVGEPHASGKDERMLAFDLGKRLAYLRPERYVIYALQALPRLEVALQAALAAAGVTKAAAGSDVARMAAELEAQVPSAALAQVRILAGKLGERGPLDTLGIIASWATAMDLTANRVGLILCNDLETAARLVATENAPLSTLPVKERLRELLLYSVSESYANVRRHLGLSVGAAE